MTTSSSSSSTNLRTSNPTDESHRKNCRISSDLAAIHPKLLNSLGQDSDGKLSDVRKCRTITAFSRNPDIPTLSDIRRLPIGILFQRFCRNSLSPIGSYWCLYSGTFIPMMNKNNYRQRQCHHHHQIPKRSELSTRTCTSMKIS